MKIVKAKDMKPGVVAAGHDKRDFPPATVVSIEPSRDATIPGTTGSSSPTPSVAARTSTRPTPDSRSPVDA